MNCYEAIDLMDEELEGRLAPELRADFDEHLEICSACGTYLDQIRATLQALERLPRQNITPDRRTELIAAFQRERKKKS
jgi:predicted anti-sigma-YlaC factor YlaD